MPQPFLELNADVTERSLRKLGEQLAGGKITAAQFEAKAREEIRSATVAAFRFANGGPLKEPQVKLLNNLLSEQKTYFDRMTAGFRDGSIPLEHAPGRAVAYAGSTISAGAYGAVTGQAKDSAFVWRGPDGASSCADCASRIGRTFTKAELLSLGMPGQTACLFRCRCQVAPVEEAA